MLYQHLTENCLQARIGNLGLGPAELEKQLGRAGGALEKIRQSKNDGDLPVLDVPAWRDDLALAATAIEPLVEDCREVVILGTGGSSLGGRTINALADRGFGPAAGRPKLHFAENVDPDSFEALLSALDLSRTGAVVVSKSGGTAETLMQALALIPRLSAAVGDETVARRVLAVTEPADNPLRRLAEEKGLSILDHPPGVGGRFSALTVTGMIPALLAGLDAVALRRGAAQVLEASLSAATPSEVPPAMGAALSVGLLAERGIGTSVLMPYLDRLSDFALWYRQLWAESLGKSGAGTTPIRAMGTVDQHSQLQLYLDGPVDKLFTLIVHDTTGQGPRIDSPGSDPALGLFDGRNLGDLFDAMARATAETLANKGRPVRVMQLPRLDEEVLGGLMMHFILETLIAAQLFGVDPFGQPAVEDGKVLAREYLTARSPHVS